MREQLAGIGELLANPMMSGQPETALYATRYAISAALIWLGIYPLCNCPKALRYPNGKEATDASR